MCPPPSRHGSDAAISGVGKASSSTVSIPLEEAKLARYPTYTADPDVEAFVEGFQSDLVELFAELGGGHFQIGRRYRYRDRLDPSTGDLLDRIKAIVDPDHRMNPGVLGLQATTEE